MKKTKSTTGTDWHLSTTRYNQLLKFADRCVSHQVNELAYVNGESNFIALQAMVLGHIMSQSWFKQMQRAVAKESPRDGLEVANDWALQVASDATAECAQSFEGMELEEPINRMVQAFKELLLTKTLPFGFQLSTAWLNAANKLRAYEAAKKQVS